jgi:GH25 family lysozyme M1 (1,4-beta-N-acetylmuramidase)
MVHSAGFHPNTWWLDVETTNHWSTDTQANDAVISGMIAAIRLSGGAPAIYSTNYQWGQIAGDYVPNLPAWYATGIATFFPQHWCSKTSFAGGPVYLVQGRAGSFDGAYEC